MREGTATGASSGRRRRPVAALRRARIPCVRVGDRRSTGSSHPARVMSADAGVHTGPYDGVPNKPGRRRRRHRLPHRGVRPWSAPGRGHRGGSASQPRCGARTDPLLGIPLPFRAHGDDRAQPLDRRRPARRAHVARARRGTPGAVRVGPGTTVSLGPEQARGRDGARRRSRRRFDRGRDVGPGRSHVQPGPGRETPGAVLTGRDGARRREAGGAAPGFAPDDAHPGRRRRLRRRRHPEVRRLRPLRPQPGLARRPAREPCSPPRSIWAFPSSPPTMPISAPWPSTVAGCVPGSAT